MHSSIEYCILPNRQQWCRVPIFLREKYNFRLYLWKLGFLLPYPRGASMPIYTDTKIVKGYTPSTTHNNLRYSLGFDTAQSYAKSNLSNKFVVPTGYRYRCLPVNDLNCLWENSSRDLICIDKLMCSVFSSELFGNVSCSFRYCSWSNALFYRFFEAPFFLMYLKNWIEWNIKFSYVFSHDTQTLH